MCYATFNIVSIIYHTCVIGRGIQEAHVFCHFQYCFSHLPHLCYRQGNSGGPCFFATFNIVSVIYHTCAVGCGFRRLMFLPLSIMFQLFTTPLM
jgi:hypothetical protein